MHFSTTKFCVKSGFGGYFAKDHYYLNFVAFSEYMNFTFSKIGFCAGTKGFEVALKAVKFLDWLKKFGLAKNILGSVKGQGIRFMFFHKYL